MALALGLTVLVLLLLIEMGILPPPIRHDNRPMVTFDVPPTLQSTPEPTRTVAVKKTTRPNAGSAAPTPAPKSPPPPAATPAEAPVKLLQLSDNDFAASDIGKMAAQPTDNAAGAGGGKDSGTVYGPSDGPGGAPLYAADWYRRPSQAELSTYLPKDGPVTGYGMIACKTIADYHVDDCRVLSETPGSHYGTAIRRAAWQFLVQPPRLGGKPMIGSWVRIRIDVTPEAVDLR